MTDVPDADRLEQEQTITPPDELILPIPPVVDPEAPEADAFEQALPAPFDDEEGPR
jgi:hypothetical protein